MLDTEREEIRIQLERILASKAFSRAPRLQQFLRFVVSKSLAGEESDLKETVIGVEVFQRAPDYDPTRDAIVRTNATRVRQKLTAYYQDEGRSEPWTISLPTDSYIPRIVRRETAPDPPAQILEASHSPTPQTSAPVIAPSRSAPFRFGMLIVIALAAPLLALLLLTRQTFDPTPPVVSLEQMTRDGRRKGDALFTDGRFVYFEWTILNRTVPAAMPVDGGEPVALPVPLPNPELMDMAPGPRFLIKAPNSEGLSFLWDWKPGQNPLPMRKSTGGYAVWGPNDDVIEDNADGELLGLKSGSSMKLPGIISSPRWSPSLGVVRLTLGDPIKLTHAMWEARLPTLAPQPVSGFPPGSSGGSWTPDGQLFVFLAPRLPVSWLPDFDVWLFRERGFSHGAVAPMRLTQGPLNFRSATLSTDGQRVFAIGETYHGELVRFDFKSGQFVPFVGHLWAIETDFSPNTEWIAYVRYPDRTLWKMKADGTQMQQLTFPPLGAHEPHWSPDGSQIAFMGEPSPSRFRVYTIASSGGVPVELAPFDPQDQGVPTWSPDGKRILFGELLQRRPKREMAVRMLDLDRHTLEELPQSKGVWTPRWSPHGRFILGLSSDSRKLLLSGGPAQAWRELAAMDFIDHPAWSRDESAIYFLGERNGRTDKAFFRFVIPTSTLERLIDLNEFEAPGFGWFGVTPDGVPLATRSIELTEVYSMKLPYRR